MNTVETECNNVLYVRTFGGFSMRWNGSLIAGSARSGESQFTYLMQILLHNPVKGVSRNQLEDLLFGDRDISNVHHAMQSVIYNAKKKLKKAGLPDVNYITLKKGVFYWTEEIPVEEDAVEFERLIVRAGSEEDTDQKLDDYLRACDYYRGEFLPAQAGVIWAAQEARRYRGMFCACVEKAVELLRERQDYFQMERLGLYASGTSPLSDWETVIMEALVAMGRLDDARKLYDDTVEFYMQEQGLRPSKKMMEMMEKLGTQMKHRYEVLDAIQTELSRDNVEQEGGGYLCTYPVFQGIYHMVKRIMERGGQSVYLMLCTVVDGRGNPMKEGGLLEELSERLGEAICRSVRHSDAVNRYGKGQYLVLLINTTRENCEVVQRRINYHFIVGRQRTGVQYYVNSVICEQEKR